MKKMNLVLAGLLIVGATALGKTYKIGSSQILEHPSLDAVRIGVEETLKKNKIDYELDSQMAQGDMGIQQLIMEKFAKDKKDYVIAISTPTAQAAVNSIKTIPILFGAVTDPKSAGLTNAANITGISDAAPPEMLIEITQKILPKAKTVGVLYNPSEKNSEMNVEKLQILTKEKGLELVAIGVTNMSEIPSAADVILSKIDVLYTLTDNLTVAASPAIFSKAKMKKIPVIAMAGESQVELGALAGIGIDYKESGNQLGEMIVKMINGESIKNLPIISPTEYPVVVNKEVAKAYKIDLSPLNK